MIAKTFARAGLLALAMSTQAPVAQAFNVEAGPIWSTEDAQRKCPAVCDRTGWDGNWTTTIPGRMSVCNCGAPGGARGLPRGPGFAGPGGPGFGSQGFNRPQPTIQVRRAIYGRQCPQSGSEVADIRAACNGRPVCTYRVDVNRISDPCYGKRKDYFVEWSCGAAGSRTASLPPEANGKTVTLSCR